MKSMNRLISTIVLVAFLLNTVVSDLALSQPLNYPINSDKLAPTSMFGTIRDTTSKDIANLTVTLDAYLAKVAGNRDFITLDELKMEGKPRKDIAQDKTTFLPANIQFFFNEPKETLYGALVKCKIKDDRTSKPRTYYAAFGLSKDNGGFPIAIATENEYKKFEKFSENWPARRPNTEVAIKDYTKAEKSMRASTAGVAAETNWAQVIEAVKVVNSRWNNTGSRDQVYRFTGSHNDPIAECVAYIGILKYGNADEKTYAMNFFRKALDHDLTLVKAIATVVLLQCDEDIKMDDMFRMRDSLMDLLSNESGIEPFSSALADIYFELLDASDTGDGNEDNILGIGSQTVEELFANLIMRLVLGKSAGGPRLEAFEGMTSSVNGKGPATLAPKTMRYGNGNEFATDISFGRIINTLRVIEAWHKDRFAVRHDSKAYKAVRNISKLADDNFIARELLYAALVKNGASNLRDYLKRSLLRRSNERIRRVEDRLRWVIDLAIRMESGNYSARSLLEGAARSEVYDVYAIEVARLGAALNDPSKAKWLKSELEVDVDTVPKLFAQVVINLVKDGYPDAAKFEKLVSKTKGTLLTDWLEEAGSDELAETARLRTSTAGAPQEITTLIKKMEPPSKVFENGGTLDGTYSAIIKPEIMAMCNKIDKQFKTGLTTTIGIIRGEKLSGNIVVLIDGKERKIGVYESFVKNVSDKLVRKQMVEKDQDKIDAMREVIRAIVRASILREIGHCLEGFEGYCSKDIYGLLEDEDTRELYAGMVEGTDAKNNDEVLQAIRDFSIGGESNSEYIQNMAAYLFGTLICTIPATSIEDGSWLPKPKPEDAGKSLLETAIKEKISTYFKENLPTKAKKDQAIIDGITAGIIERYSLFFSNNSKGSEALTFTPIANAGQTKAERDAFFARVAADADQIIHLINLSISDSQKESGRAIARDRLKREYARQAADMIALAKAIIDGTENSEISKNNFMTVYGKKVLNVVESRVVKLMRSVTATSQQGRMLDATIEPLLNTRAQYSEKGSVRQSTAGAEIEIDQLLGRLESGIRDVRKEAVFYLKLKYPALAPSVDAYYAALPISGHKILEKAKETGRPVIACNIDNGELSAIQIRSMMKAALDMNAYIMFEVGPAALKTYADGKPQLPEYCAREALQLYKETGKAIVYAVHLDHNQINAKDYYKGGVEDRQAAFNAAINRAKLALAQGFTSFATDTSTITDVEKENVVDRLKNVIITSSSILRTIYEGARELGIAVGNEGEVGDIGKKISTVEEAVVYYNGLVTRLGKVATRLGDTKPYIGPAIDVIALNLGTSHGYDFDDNDRLKPYKEGRIDVARAREVHEEFKRMGLNIGVALHGFSGTPIEFAKGFVDTGIAKVNVNTDWQAITWKVLEAYYPELYKEIFTKAREAARAGKPGLVTDNEGYDFVHAKNRIMFGYARTLFRNKENHPLLERITNTLQNGERVLPVVRIQKSADHIKMELTLNDREKSITASEAIYRMTYGRVTDLMKALDLKDSAEGITIDRTSALRLQDWQIGELKELAEGSARSRLSTTGTKEPLIFDDAAQSAKWVAREVIEEVKKDPNTVLGLLTGGTPIPVYEEIVRLTRNEEINWSGVKIFYLDEYLGIDPKSPQSYRSYMLANLYEPLRKANSGIRLENIHVPDAAAKNPEKHMLEYADMIKRAGGVKLWIIGMGRSCHYAFFEPATRISLAEYGLLKAGVDHTEANNPLIRKIRDFNEYYLSAEFGNKYGQIRESIINILSVQSKIRENLSVFEDIVKDVVDVSQSPDSSRAVSEEQAVSMLSDLGKRMKGGSETDFYVPLNAADRMKLMGDLKREGYKNINICGSEDYFGSAAKVVSLALPTIIDNSRYFNADLSEVPLKALSATGVVMESARIIQIVTNPRLAGSIRDTIEAPGVTCECPSTEFKTHPDYTLAITKEAAVNLKRETIEHGIAAAIAATTVRKSTAGYADRNIFDIKRYETEISRYITHMMSLREFAEIEGRAADLGIDGSPERVEPAAYWKKVVLDELRRGTDEFLRASGAGDFDTVFKGKNFIFIKTPGEKEFSITDEENGEIAIRSHVTDNAVYFFVRSSLFDSINKRLDNSLIQVDAQTERLAKISLGSLDKAVIHAAGVIGGEKVYAALGRLEHDLDIRYGNPAMEEAPVVVSDANRGRTSTAGQAVLKEIEDMKVPAEDVGRNIPTAEDMRYTLIVDYNLSTDEERRKDIDGYDLGDGRHLGAANRFGLVAADTDNVENILARLDELKLDPSRTIVQVSNELSDADIGKLREKAKEIRVVRVDTSVIGTNDDLKWDRDKRRDYRFDLYAYMLAARAVTKEDIQENSATYRILKFFVKTHIAEEVDDLEQVVTDYIAGLAQNDISAIIKRSLSYRPVARWDVQTYHEVTATLISA